MVKPAAHIKQPRNKGTSGFKFRSLVFIAALIAVGGCAADLMKGGRGPQVIGEPVKVGYLANTQLNEVSGLTSSRVYPGLLWAINDGGDDPRLYAVGTDGADLGSFRIEGAKNNDWEALASFRLQDTAYLLIADVGDNWRQRENSIIYVVEEPAITATGLNDDTTIGIAWQIRFTYEDGPQDCEAVAVDKTHQRILLLAKRSRPPVLYELPLKPVDPDEISVAQRLTTVPHFNWPTAMDISRDGFSALVLTYNNGYVYKRRKKEDWPGAFKIKPQRLQFDRLFQQEAACFGFYGKSVYVTSERLPAPLVRIDLE